MILGKNRHREHQNAAVIARVVRMRERDESFGNLQLRLFIQLHRCAFKLDRRFADGLHETSGGLVSEQARVMDTEATVERNLGSSHGSSRSNFIRQLKTPQPAGCQPVFEP